MIEHIVWDEQFKVGHPMIDSQHRHLFELADGLFNVQVAGIACKRENVELVIQECSEYVIFHFAAEEELMREVGYPDMESHVKEHRDFSKYVSTLFSDFSSGKDISLGDLYTHIAKWLVQHIVLEDRKLASYVSNAAD